MNQSDKQQNSKGLFSRWSREATIISILIHLLFIGGAVYIVALRIQNKPEAVFRSDPPPRPRLKPRELEMKVRVQDLQKQSARPRLQPRMVSMSPSEVALPEIKKDPDADKKKVQRNITNLGMSGFGSGIGGGLGTGMGGGGGVVNFFGLQSTGNRIAYLVDYSGSMVGKRQQVMRKELAASLKALPAGAEVCLIFFSGYAWIAGKGVMEEPQNFTNDHLRSYKGPRRMPKWLVLTPNTKRELLKYIKRDKLTFGTDWMKPFELAFKLNPKPDIIYFMTDGSPQKKNIPQVVKKVKQWNRRTAPGNIPINTIAIGDPKAIKGMKQLASDSGGGKYRYVNVKKYK